MLVDDTKAPVTEAEFETAQAAGRASPVNLNLEWVLGKMPRKVWCVWGLILSPQAASKRLLSICEVYQYAVIITIFIQR